MESFQNAHSLPKTAWDILFAVEENFSNSTNTTGLLKIGPKIFLDSNLSILDL